MADLNEVRLIGRLTRDPELRTTQGGASVCTFGLATNRKYKSNDGKITDETTFVDVTCWGKTAENASKYIKKGSLVYLGGRLKYDHWEDKTTGQTRTKISVVAENVQFLDGRSATQSGDQSQPATQASVAGTAWSEPDFEEPPF